MISPWNITSSARASSRELPERAQIPGPQTAPGWAWRCLLGLAAAFGIGQTVASNAALLTITNFQDFNRAPGTNAGDWVLTSPGLSAGFPWRELVVSWNAATNVALTVEARPHPLEGGRFYTLGHWASRPDPGNPRESVNGQKDEIGVVKTDTLVLAQPAEGVQVRITVRGPETGLKRVSLALTGIGISTTNQTPPGEVWGRELNVPVRSQAEFPEGVTQWCSPTCTTMLLAFWGGQLGREDLVHPVSEIAAAVFDPGWGGTGNWPFNMAFAGSHSGMNAAVARFRDLGDLERWVGAGSPAAASVNYALLKGQTQPAAGDGHLVVVRGLTADGDVIVNDPGVRLERVRRVFPRADFERAWAHSGRTVYLVWPDGFPLPVGPAFPR